MAGLLWLFRGAALAARKIQAYCALPRDLRREVVASLRTATIFSLVGLGLYGAASRGWITLYPDFARRGVGYFIATFAFMILAHDAYFYWTHRLMHHRRLFRWFHLTHHLSHAPTPWAAYAFAVPEALVQGAFLPLFAAIVPLHELTLLAFMTFQIVRNVMGHAGFEIHPGGFIRSPWLRWNNTTTHHDLHHETGRYNFGLYFRWWDRMMGTEHPEYRARFEALVGPDRVHAREAAAQ